MGKYKAIAKVIGVVIILFLLGILLYVYVPPVNSFINETLDLIISVGKVLGVIFRWWFFWGMIAGFVIMALVYMVLRSLSSDEEYHGNILKAKNTALFVGSFLAVGGLVTDSLDDTVKLDRSKYTSNQKLSIKSLEDNFKKINSAVVGCDISKIYVSSKDIVNKSELSANMADKVLLCSFKEKYKSVTEVLIDRIKYPENIKNVEGINKMIKEVENDQTESVKILSLLNNKTTFSSVNLDKVRESTKKILSDFQKLKKDERVSDRLSKIKGIIFSGIGIDASVFLLSILLLILSSTSPKLRKIQDALNKAIPETLKQEAEHNKSNEKNPNKPIKDDPPK